MSSMPDLSEFEVSSQVQLSPDEAAPLVNSILGGDRLSFPYAYWRRPDGWITVGAYWPVELMRQMSLGWLPMMQYGEFQERNPNEQGGPWNLNGDQWKRLFLRGGAKEFPLDQIMEYRWHKKPPVVNGRPVKFPQFSGEEYEALAALEVKCRYCRKPYLNDADLTNHERVAHRDVSQQASLARALGDVMGEAKSVDPSTATNDALVALLTKLVDRVEALEKGPAKK